MRFGLGLKASLAFSTGLMAFTFMMPFIPEGWSSGTDMNGSIVLLIWPPSLIMLCASVWLYLSGKAGDDDGNGLLTSLALVTFSCILWALAIFFMSDQLDSLAIDRSWKGGLYFAWVGSSIVAVAVTILIWAVFWSLKLNGSSPLPYLVVGGLLFLISTPVLPVSIIDVWSLSSQQSIPIIIGVTVSSSVIGALLWGMLFDRYATGIESEWPSSLKLTGVTLLGFGVIPVFLAASNLIVVGFSGDSSLMAMSP